MNEFWLFFVGLNIGLGHLHAYIASCCCLIFYLTLELSQLLMKCDSFRHTAKPRDPAIPLLGIHPERNLVQRDTRTQCPQSCLQQPRHGRNLNVH